VKKGIHEKASQPGTAALFDEISPVNQLTPQQSKRKLL
jgi:hypothetical protein